LLRSKLMKSHALDRSRYAPELLARVAAGWQRLSGEERHGVLNAARVAADLAELGAPPAIVVLAAHVVQDEIHHLEVCDRVLEQLDPAASPFSPLELAVARERPATDESELARRLIGDFALGKPVTAAAFATARAQVREPLFAWAYTELLHDETRHATFGAKAAAWVIRHWSTRQRQALWTECLTTVTKPPASLPADPEAEALGLLPAQGDATLPPWILPHLAPLGLHPRPANDQAFIH
jgi:hypothetical protein